MGGGGKSPNNVHQHPATSRQVKNEIAFLVVQAYLRCIHGRGKGEETTEPGHLRHPRFCTKGPAATR